MLEVHRHRRNPQECVSNSPRLGSGPIQSLGTLWHSSLHHDACMRYRLFVQSFCMVSQHFFAYFHACHMLVLQKCPWKHFRVFRTGLTIQFPDDERFSCASKLVKELSGCWMYNWHFWVTVVDTVHRAMYVGVYTHACLCWCLSKTTTTAAAMSTWCPMTIWRLLLWPCHHS